MRVSLSLVVNTVNFAPSTYEHFGFNSLAQFNDSYLAADESGIYLLEGADDEGDKIEWEIKAGPKDFGLNELKRLRDIYMTYRSNGQLRIKVKPDEDQYYERELTGSIDRIHEERVKFGKGMKGRYYEILLENIDGSDIELDSMRIMGEPIKRRTR